MSAAAATSTAPTSARLYLYTGKCAWPITKLYSEVTISGQQGTAYAFSKKFWYAVALEVDGKRVPFANNEHVQMKVSVERRRLRGGTGTKMPDALAILSSTL